MGDSIYGARIEIYNKPLCDILARYRDAGAFSHSKSSSRSLYRVVVAEADPEENTHMAYFFRDNRSAFSVKDVPTRLQDVTTCLLVCLCHEFSIPKSLFLSLKNEIEEHLVDLEQQYDYVYWEKTYTPIDGDYDPVSGVLQSVRTFTYNRYADISDYTEKLRRSGFLDEKYYGIRLSDSFSNYDWDSLIKDLASPEPTLLDAPPK